MGRGLAYNTGSDAEKAKLRFVSTGEGTTIESDQKKYEEAKEKMRKRLEEMRNA